MRLQVEYLPIDSIKTYENNAKLHPAEQIEQIKKSIQEFSMNDPIAVWKDNIVIEGHGRLIACKELGFTEIPVIRLDNLTDEQRRAYMLVHNKLTMNTDFDPELLSLELEDINLDMEVYGFDIPSFEELMDDNKYTDKTDIPQYEPSGEEWGIDELYDDSKAKNLIEEIEKASVDDRIKGFLILAAYRHVKFNYKRIADFYARATPEVQKMMEQSALVIIDFNDAIKNGYTNLDKVAGEYTVDA